MAWQLKTHNRSYSIVGKADIGRDASADIHLSDDQASRRHAKVFEQGNALYVRDEGSANGTFVNQRKIGSESTLLRAGDVLRVGHTDLNVIQQVIEAADMVLSGSLPIDMVHPKNNYGHNKRQIKARRPLSNDLIVWLVVGGVTGLLLLSGIILTLLSSGSVSSTVGLSNVSVPTAGYSKAVISSTIVPTVVPPPNRDALMDQARRTVVQVIAPLATDKVQTGSGSVIHADGVIVTNYHVVFDEDKQRIINKVAIFMTSNDLGLPPALTYIAEVDIAHSNAALDIAVLKIVADKNQKTVSNLSLPFVIPMGNSDGLGFNDVIEVCGFPSVGGNTLTCTQGKYSGNEADGKVLKGWIKTDATINPGNSGGPAINNKGELVGIATASRSSKSSGMGGIGLIRPINAIKDLLK